MPILKLFNKPKVNENEIEEIETKYSISNVIQKNEHTSNESYESNGSNDAKKSNNVNVKNKIKKVKSKFKLSILLYPFAICFIFVSYWTFIEGEKYRIPAYFMPDGRISAFGNKAFKKGDNRIISINDLKPSDYPIFSDNVDTVTVKTDKDIYSINLIKKSVTDIMTDFAFFIFGCIIFILSSIWFIRNTKDIYLFLPLFSWGLFFLFYPIIVTERILLIPWQICSSLLAISLINFILRTTGRIIRTRYLILEIIYLSLLVLVAYIGRENYYIIKGINIVNLSAAFLAITSTAVLQFIHALKKTSNRKTKIKRWVLFLGSFLGLIIPQIAMMNSYINLLKWGWVKSTFVFILFFPILMLYGTFKVQAIPFQSFISKSLYSFIKNSVIGILFAIFIFTENIFLPKNNFNFDTWVSHSVFLFLLLIFIEPISNFINEKIKWKKFWEDPKYEASIHKMIENVNTTTNIQSTLNSFLLEVKNLLNLNKVDLIITEKDLPNLVLDSSKIIRLNHKSKQWDYIDKYGILVTDYFSYADDSVKNLFGFMFENKYSMIIGSNSDDDGKLIHFFQKFNFFKIKKATYKSLGAIAVSYKKGDSTLSLKDIRYLIEVSRLLQMVFESYNNLISEIDKRRRMRDLQTAGQSQKRLPLFDKTEIENINYTYITKAALNVSGDYFDLININKEEIVCVLGDVSGHGLGTGYLVSSIRTIMRTLLFNGATLVKSIETVNNFLLERFSGENYITMVTFKLNIFTGEVEYINAAHPASILFNKEKETLTFLESYLPVLGAMPLEVNSKNFKLNKGDRLFIYSDGLTETFNDKKEPFGEENLYKILKENKGTNIKKLLDIIQIKLNEHSLETPLSDDITMAVLEFLWSN